MQRKEGEIKVTDIRLRSFNGTETSLSRAFVEASVFEDIYSGFVTAIVTVYDTFNLIERFPIIGHETLTLQFRSAGLPNTDENTINLELAVYKVANITSEKAKEQQYSLYCISKEAIRDSQTKISKAYSDLSSNIIQDIVRNELKSDKPLTIEESAYRQDIVVPNWSPMFTAKWLCRRSISQQHKDASYVFFETTRGFVFQTLESLNDVKDPVKFINLVDRVEKGDINTNFNRAFTYQINDSLDTINFYDDGLFAGKLYSHDPVKKQFRTFEYNYIDDFKNYVHLEDSKTNPSLATNQTRTICPPKQRDSLGKRVSDYPNARQEFFPSHTAMHEGGTSIAERPELWLMQRNSRLAQMTAYVVNLEMLGDSRVTVGQVVDLQFPSFDTTRDTTKKRYFNGRFLITGVKHTFTPDTYRTYLEVSKDSVKEEFEGGVIIANARN